MSDPLEVIRASSLGTVTIASNLRAQRALRTRVDLLQRETQRALLAVKIAQVPMRRRQQVLAERKRAIRENSVLLKRRRSTVDTHASERRMSVRPKTV